MLSLASILNPASPGQGSDFDLDSPSGASPSRFSFHRGSPPAVQYPLFEAPMMPKEEPGALKSKVKGTVKFYPFEDLDGKSLHEVRRFRVTPFGGIRNNCRHIPYNSGKKDFFEKTGRESFEVFQYTFKLPNDETEYAVMWDYNVGLVRMTPFFKCCNYPKTTPAKMLNLNPGLRDITHSITGGSIMAQGYWMPFSCAKAVCATFCHHISGALIPIFGPQFPSECTHPDSPDHGRMCIDGAIVREAKLEAERFRRLYAEQASVAIPISPRQQQQRRDYNNQQSRMQRPYNMSSPSQNRHLFGGVYLPDSPSGTDTEEYEGVSGGENGDAGLYHYNQTRYACTPVRSYRAVHTAGPTSTSRGWTAANQKHSPGSWYKPSDRHLLHGPISKDTQQQYGHANPILSALPSLHEYTPLSSPSQTRPFLQTLQPRYCNTSTAAQLLLTSTSSSATATSLVASNPAAPPTPIMSPKRPRVAPESSTAMAPEHEYGRSESHIYGDSCPAASRAGGEDGRQLRPPQPASRHEYKLHSQSHRRRPSHHHHTRPDLQLPPVSVAATVAERNAALLLMNLSVGEGRDEKDANKDTAKDGKLSGDKEVGGSLQRWAAVIEKAEGQLETSGDEQPAKKKRRTVSF